MSTPVLCRLCSAHRTLHPSGICSLHRSAVDGRPRHAAPTPLPVPRVPTTESFDYAEAATARSRIELTDTVSAGLGLSPAPVAVAAWVYREGYRTPNRAQDERSQRVYAEAVVAAVVLDTPSGKVPAAARISAALLDAGFSLVSHGKHR